MTPLKNLNSRNLLIAIHDAVETTLAVLASFYLRFEGDLLADRLPLLLLILPFFIVLTVVVCYLFNLTTTKWCRQTIMARRPAVAVGRRPRAIDPERYSAGGARRL